ncbi:hypothetical protein PAHAL_4G061200 [Panicum hallii]|jgi:hypothetical protein|uniref:Hydrophobic seed protein domain-containing protein n=1 Tax=Panicum hallii TaxID=206008 RepID=A0A2T8JBY6_9POAL|nr:hypothetical protein PAHAL_4G061200 [Panicum hallii]
MAFKPMAASPPALLCLAMVALALAASAKAQAPAPTPAPTPAPKPAPAPSVCLCPAGFRNISGFKAAAPKLFVKCGLSLFLRTPTTISKLTIPGNLNLPPLPNIPATSKNLRPHIITKCNCHLAAARVTMSNLKSTAITCHPAGQA